MQLAEPEMIVPLNTKSGIRIQLILISFLDVLILALVGWNTLQLARLEGGSVDWVMLILWILLLLCFGWIVIWSIRKLHAPAPTLRVSHEGIFFSSVLIGWDEIQAIFPYEAPGAGLVVGIVVRDYEALLERYAQEKSLRVFRRFAGRANAWLLHFFRYRAQVNIPQRLLPLSIPEFMAEIRTRFAAEFHEYQIPIREWQY